MKKTLITVLVLVVIAYPGLAWWMGHSFESQHNESLQQLLDQAPYLKVTQDKLVRGWYSSEQDLTFSLSPAISAGRSISFKVHNHIQHGPICGWGCFGEARIDSRLVWSDEIRAELAKVYGKEEPLKIETRLGLFGGGTTTFSSPAIKDAVYTDTPKVTDGAKDADAAKDAAAPQQLHFSTEGMLIKLIFSKHLDSMSVHGGAPRMLMTGPDGTHVELAGLQIDAESHRALRTLYAGTARLVLKKVEITGMPGADAHKAVQINDIEYNTNVQDKSPFMDLGAKMGTGAINVGDVKVLNTHFDYSLTHVAMEPMESLTQALRAIYKDPNVESGQQMQQVQKMMEPLKKYGTEILLQQPVMSFDRISIATTSGEAIIKGPIHFTDLKASDVDAGASPLALVQKLDADLDFSLDDKLLQDLPGQSATEVENKLQGLAQQGFITRENGHSHTRILMHQGQLTINGKAVPLPGAAGTGGAAP